MEPQEKDSTEIHGCDESKCVSKGMSNLSNESFTCYGDDGNSAKNEIRPSAQRGPVNLRVMFCV
jgi:hypothetical protein